MIIDDIKIEIIENGFFKHNAYVIIKDNNCVIIDPGSDYHKFNEFIKSRGLKIDFIIITHGHYDHFASLNSILKQDPKIKYYGSEKLNDVITNKEIHLGTNKDSVINIQNNILHDGDVIKFKNIDIKCIETPGHIIDHICLYLPKYNALFTGDILFKNNIGTSRFPTGSASDIKQSLKKIFRMCELKTIIFPGHGDISDLETEKLKNPYLTFLN